jgi:hypothetical protein
MPDIPDIGDNEPGGYSFVVWDGLLARRRTEGSVAYRGGCEHAAGGTQVQPEWHADGTPGADTHSQAPGSR